MSVLKKSSKKQSYPTAPLPVAKKDDPRSFTIVNASRLKKALLRIENTEQRLLLLELFLPEMPLELRKRISNQPYGLSGLGSKLVWPVEFNVE